MKTEEWFPLVDEEGNTTGKATRKECHGGSRLLHPVVHLHIFDKSGRLYLQKRSMKKDIQPGKWDTAVGGHVDYGEEIEDALYREAREELGLTGFVPIFCYRYVWESPVERELVYTFYTICENEIIPNKSELDDGRFWKSEEILSYISKDIFTPNFEKEFSLLFEFLKDQDEKPMTK
jgi:isopentenyldiphosphate isomerase